MTVIACDGKQIASDSQWNNRDQRILCKTPKLIKVKDHIFGISGADLLHVLIDWYLRGHEPDKLPRIGKNEWWELVVIKPNGDLLILNDDVPYARFLSFPFASGSGSEYALGAMMAGASARRAVEIACHFDVYCGGEILVFDLPQARKEVAA